MVDPKFIHPSRKIGFGHVKFYNLNPKNMMHAPLSYQTLLGGLTCLIFTLFFA
jgi:hypothetical protein